MKQTNIDKKVIIVPKHRSYSFFNSSFFEIPSCVRDFELDFSSDFATENTIMSILIDTGLSMQNKGTIYLHWLFTTIVNRFTSPLTMSDYFALISRQFKSDKKAIERSIARVLNSTKATHLFRLNDLLGGKVVISATNVRVSDFVCNVAARLIMLKAHKEGRVLAADDYVDCPFI